MNKLNQLLEEVLEVKMTEIEETALFSESSDWDSLKQVRLVVGIQSTYDIELGREEIQTMVSVADVRDVVSKRGFSS